MEYELFSKRQQRMQGETADTYPSETIPQKLRVQVLYIWGKVWGKADYDDYFGKFQLSEFARDAFNLIEMTLREEYGVLSLDGDDDPDEDGYDLYRAVRDFLLKTEDTNKVIDVIEVSFRYIDQVIRDKFYVPDGGLDEIFGARHRDISHDDIPPDEAIDQLNRRFSENSVWYQYKSGQIEKVDSQYIHSEVVKPAEDSITELDLKDYDRQKPPLQENEVDVSRSDFLPEYKFHPMIPQNVWSSFSQGAYGSAVFEAFKQVEIAVREAGYYAKADHGVSLMRKAFQKDTGNLTDTNQPSAERIAIEHLFVGAIGYCRNPLGHREVNLSAEEAVEMIFLASYLLRIVDSRKQSDGDWQEQFANRFVRHLKNRESPLMDPEVFMGEDDWGYPRYIGFNIGKIEYLDIEDRNAIWLVASTVHDGKIYLKLHMNNSAYFDRLKLQKAAIEREFGGSLKWEPRDQSQRIRIGVDIEVNPLDENRGQWNQNFEEMREKLEKLNEIFQSRIEDLFFDDIPF